MRAGDGKLFYFNLSDGLIVTRCIKVAKNGIQQRRAALAERARAGAGGVVVMDSNPA